MPKNLTDERIPNGYWKDKRFFASPEVMRENPRRKGVVGWHSLDLIGNAGVGGLSYADWRAGFSKNVTNISGTGHNHLRWDYERGRIDVVKDQGMGTPTPFNSISSDLKKLQHDTSIPETTRQALINARVGQGKFRTDLMLRWDNACAVTGVKQEQLLRASHIKSWAKCSNEERLNPSNGLLLSANIDALFDRGLVTFKTDGSMMLSDLVTDKKTIELLGLPLRLRYSLQPAKEDFLIHHRSKTFR